MCRLFPFRILDDIKITGLRVLGNLGDSEASEDKRTREDPEEYHYYGTRRERGIHQGDVGDHRNSFWIS